MPYKLTTLDTIGKYDVPIAYINSKSLTFKDMFVIDNYEHLVDENVSLILSKTNYINAYKRNNTYFLNITNVPNTILITNRFYFDPVTQNSIPLFYKYKSIFTNCFINFSMLSSMEQTFDITFNSNANFLQSRIMHTSLNTLPITNYDSVPYTARAIKIYDITDGPSFTPIDNKYYTIDHTTMMVYFSYQYYTDLVLPSSVNRKFRITYFLSQNPIIYENVENDVFHLKPELIVREEKANGYEIDIFIYTDSKYAVDISYNGFSSAYQERMIPEKTYKRVVSDEFLINQTYKFVDPSEYNNYQTSIAIGDACPFSKYAIINELDTSTILNIQTDDFQTITNDHFYIDTTYGIIYRSKEINPVTSLPGLTYEIKNPAMINGEVYELYTGSVINLGNKSIKLNHDDIVYTWNSTDNTLSGITVTKNNLTMVITSYNDRSRIITINEDIYDNDVLTVSYVYRKKTIKHKSFCLNPTPYHSYHNNEIVNKIVVIGIVAKEALIPNAPMSVFPFYLDRYINNTELYYTYDTINALISDQNIVLGTPSDNGISISELKRYLNDDYLNYNEETGYPYQIPIMILGSISLLNTMDVNYVTTYNTNRLGTIELPNSTINTTQSRFDTAYYDSYPININNIFNVNVFDKMKNITARKLFNKDYQNLTEQDQYSVKKLITDRIKFRMLHDKRCMVTFK